MPEAGIELTTLEKRYGATLALERLSLRVAAGEIVGLIGPDGAGKTTAMRIACGLVTADRGQARVLGHDCARETRRVKEQLGYMPQRFSLYPDLSVAENLRFVADLYAVPGPERRRREEHLMAFSGLGPFRRRRAAHLSGGMQQKLALCCTLIHTPRVLILDEPTTGVDVVSRREFWTILRGLAGDGLALLVSTPYMDEAERVDRIVLMHQGRAIATGTPAEIIAGCTEPLVEISGPDTWSAWRRLRRTAPPGIRLHRLGDRFHVILTRPAAGAALDGQLRGLALARRERAPAIEDAFVSLVAKTSVEGP